MDFFKIYDNEDGFWCVGIRDMAEEITFFHDRVMFLLVAIVLVVL